MIEISIYRTEDSFSLEAKGHAGRGEKGWDVICAGVSALVQTLKENLEQRHAATMVIVKDGDAFIRGEGPAAAVVFEVIAVGLQMIADKCPECVKISRIEW